MQPSQILAIAVFVFTYALIVLPPKRINEAHAALLGAALTIVLLLKPHHVLEALGISTLENPAPLVTTWNVVVILATLISFPEIISSFITSFTFCTVFIKFTSQTS